ncbi:MarR family winged helix-turn-helix transcriptional regulator [Mucilaginibacter ximonensis]|uniref:MarR family winged helix-turn-helix transcriptional regulator n=1 Tax=Mucilaginibacter ximonensis TaxID=538021 RepID=A0ABW5YG86_9SPHI
METSQLASAFRMATSLIIKRLRRSVKSANSYSISEFQTLSYLYPDQAFSASELATIVRVKPQSMSELLINLKELGIVEKTPHEVDKRKSLISLTQKGREIVEHTRYERDEWLARAIDNTLSAEEKQTLEAAVAILNKIVAYEPNI